MIGAGLGAELGKALDGQRLLVLFGLLMIGVGMSMLRKRRAAEAPDVRLTRKTAATLLPRLLPIGLGVGLAAGFFGIGGGFLIVPGLILATAMPLSYAIGTSLFVVSALGLTTATSYAVSGFVDWPVAGLLIAGGMAGTIAGISLGRVLGTRKGLLERGFAGVFITVGAYVVASSAQATAQCHRSSLEIIMADTTTPHPKVLIVGAGAMGLTLGYHLHLAAASVTYLVRPGRVAELSRPHVLYSYDDAQLKSFSDYAVASEIEAATASQPDYVIVTLDGASTRSAEGTALLRELGAAISATDAILIGGGVGLGLRDHYVATTGLADKRIMMATLGSLAYQVDRVDLPVHPPTDATLLGRADIAYRHYGKAGLMVENRDPAAARRLAALYDGCGVARCMAIEPHLLAMISESPFAIFTASELMGWPSAASLAKNKPLWRLAVKAVQEVVRMKHRGWRGKVAGIMLRRSVVSKIWGSIEKASRPLDFQAFNAFHHGRKVGKQDIEIMEACVAQGERNGQSMASLKRLLAMLATHRSSPNATGHQS
ncbi:MAG TPA: TSUP family transporter [Sphingomonas sp.]|jgi:hypothetical protein